MLRDDDISNDGRGISHKYKDPDAEWKRIQQNTFTRWTNQHLKKANMTITDLETEFSDGLKLIALIEVLSHKEMPTYNKKPKIRMMKLENVSIALEFLDKEGVVLLSIDSSHIVDCKLKLILGMIWTLILHYSISIPMSRPGSEKDKQNKTPKQQLMDWVNIHMPDLNVNNFTSDWKDGKTIGALVESTGPGLCPDWQDWDPNKPVQNATEAMDLAENWLDVPKLLTPEEMVNPNIDEQSMMTYLSQFPNASLKPGAPLKQKGEVKDLRVYGPGIEETGVMANTKTHFTVEAMGDNAVELTVQIIDSKGRIIECELMKCFSIDDESKKASYNCTYTAAEEGELEITVLWSKRAVAKSPYRVLVEGTTTSILKVTANGSGLEYEGNYYVQTSSNILVT